MEVFGITVNSAETRVIEKDKKQNKILTAGGYKVFRFSEGEITNSTAKCVDKIEKYINKICD